MGKIIVNILRIIILLLVISTGSRAYAQGQIMENPMPVTVEAEKFTFIGTLNPCDWGFSSSPSLGKEMFYSLTIDEPMNIIAHALGSDIKGVDIKISGNNGIIERSYSAESYRQFLIDNNLWNYNTYDYGQDCFIASHLLPGTYIITVRGKKVSNNNATNGPTQLTVIGYNDDNPFYTPLPVDYIPGTKLHPILIGHFATDFSATISKCTERFSGQDALPPLGLHFRLMLSTSMDLSFNIDNSKYSVSLFNDEINQYTVVNGNTADDDNIISFKEGDYLLLAILAIFVSPVEDYTISFSIIGQKWEEVRQYTNFDPTTIGKNYITTRTYLSADCSDYRDETLYADGLGRISQRILAAGSPAGGDLVWRYSYDTSGRQTHEWLPGVSSSTDGSYASLSQIDYSIYNGDKAPYSLTEYEASPLNRPKKQYGPGEEWHTSGNAVSYDYETSRSTSGNLSCFIYTADATADSRSADVTIRCMGRYGSGELLAERVTDEDGREVITFTDALGRKVLERRPVGDGIYADTYFVYDIYDNLTAVLPPEASARMAHTGIWNSSTSSDLRDYCFLYRYDGFRRKIGHRVPGCGETEFVYDSADRPVIWRDGNMKGAGRWGFRIYDIFGRETISGTCASWSGSLSIPVRSQPCGLTSDIPLPASCLSLYGYDIYGIELTDPVVNTVNYYDDYSFIGSNGVPGESHLGFASGGNGVEPYPSAKGMLTGRLTAVPVSTVSDSTEYLASAFYYDYRERLIQSVSANHLGGFDRESTEYDFVGNPVCTELIHTTATDCVGVRQRWVREFDRHGRELSVTHCLGDGTPMLLCRRGYDSLGRISEESAGDGASEALVNEYAYDIRSRAVAVSSGRYSQRLDFTPGGNVSRMDWCADASCEPWHSYRFGYDALSRVVSAEYSDDDGRRGIYDTTYDYDLNGNVTALSRRGVVSSGIGGEKYGLIDCLAYSYEGNRVVSITEDGQEVYSYGAFHFVDGADEAEEYTYNANGNITSDHNRGISDISYDVNNRARRIRFSDGGETRYIYGLDGVKRRAEHVIPGIPPVVSIGAAVSGATVTSTTDYSGAFVYEDGVLERIHLDCGYLSYRDFSGRRLTEPEYHFYQRDHLGNNRVDLCSDGSVSQITHYYPFGLPMSMGYSPESQRWKFGNKELDRINGLDLYDFEARAYDPATIRFYRPDDLADKYHPISPYAYCLNNPLINIDKDGKEVYLYATELPGNTSDRLNLILKYATHTFLAVQVPSTKEWFHFAYGSEYDGFQGAISGRLQLVHYSDDLAIMNGDNNDRVKNVIPIEPPLNDDGIQMSEEEFANKVIDVANSFGNNPEITYFMLPIVPTQGNCNTSTSTILHKSGVTDSKMEEITRQLPELHNGFGNYRPWTQEEQKKAVNRMNEIINSLDKINNR